MDLKMTLISGASVTADAESDEVGLSLVPTQQLEDLLEELTIRRLMEQAPSESWHSVDTVRAEILNGEAA